MASPALDLILELLRARERDTVATIEQARERLESLAAMSAPLPGTRFEPVQAHGVPCEWVTAPGAGDTGTIVYLHGGGYGLGSIATHRALVSRLSHASGLRALTVGYRLAPEHPFPAAVEDAAAVHRWLWRRGVAPAKVIVAGDSAGGGLAIATLLALREKGDPLPASAVCLSPWVDLEVAGHSSTAPQRDPMVGRDELLLMARLYLADADPRSPLASPLHGDLRGLPPLFVQVGTAETLLDDAVRLAERVRAAGGRAVLERWPDMIHVWHAFAPLLPEANDAIARAGAWMRACVAVRRRPVPLRARVVRARRAAAAAGRSGK